MTVQKRATEAKDNILFQLGELKCINVQANTVWQLVTKILNIIIKKRERKY